MTIKGELTVVTPAMAKKWLEANTHNRNINEADVSRYAEDMKAGAWRITHQGIGFDVDGVLVDGQHRLMAVCRAEIPVTLMVTRDLPKDAQEVVDAVRPRAVHDQLHLIDGVPDAMRTTAVCRQLSMLDTGSMRKKMSLRETREILFRFGDTVHTVMRFNHGHSRLAIAPYLATLVYAMAADPVKVTAFMTKVRDGENIQKGDPAYALREYLLAVGQSRGGGGEKERETTSVLALRAIYAAIHGQSITVLRPTMLTANGSALMAEITEFFRLANRT